jgi:hypothetical protein
MPITFRLIKVHGLGDFRWGGGELASFVFLRGGEVVSAKETSAGINLGFSFWRGSMFFGVGTDLWGATIKGVEDFL